MYACAAFFSSFFSEVLTAFMASSYAFFKASATFSASMRLFLAFSAAATAFCFLLIAVAYSFVEEGLEGVSISSFAVDFFEEAESTTSSA